MTINGATLKTTLGGLGISPGYFAERLGVTMRTVVRWFDGDTVPDAAKAELRDLESLTLEEMRQMVKTRENGNGVVVLKTYRTDRERAGSLPASWHRALTFRVFEHLKAEGKEVVVQYE